MKKSSLNILAMCRQVNFCFYSGTIVFCQVSLYNLSMLTKTYSAVEKQMFHYNDQMSSYERIIEEAISQSDNVM